MCSHNTSQYWRSHFRTMSSSQSPSHLIKEKLLKTMKSLCPKRPATITLPSWLFDSCPGTSSSIKGGNSKRFYLCTFLIYSATCWDGRFLFALMLFCTYLGTEVHHFITEIQVINVHHLPERKAQVVILVSEHQHSKQITYNFSTFWERWTHQQQIQFSPMLSHPADRYDYALFSTFNPKYIPWF